MKDALAPAISDTCGEMANDGDDEEPEYRSASDRVRREELLEVRFEREALAAVLDYFPVGVVVLDQKGKERHRNRAAQILLGEIEEDLDERGQTESAEDLREVLGQILKNSADEDLSFHSLSLEPEKIRGAFQTLKVSLSEDPSGEGGAVIFLTQPHQEREASPELLARMYDLTPAAASVAALLIGGLTTEEIAEALGIEVTTVRSHLRQLFNRTGTSRQAELVQRLLLGVSALDL